MLSRVAGAFANKYNFGFLFNWGTPPVAGSRIGSRPFSTDVALQHRNGLMAGAQAHRKQRTTENVKGTLSKGRKVCFLQCGSLPSMYLAGSNSPPHHLLVAINAVSVRGGGKLVFGESISARLRSVLCSLN